MWPTFLEGWAFSVVGAVGRENSPQLRSKWVVAVPGIALFEWLSGGWGRLMKVVGVVEGSRVRVVVVAVPKLVRCQPKRPSMRGWQERTRKEAGVTRCVATYKPHMG